MPAAADKLLAFGPVVHTVEAVYEGATYALDVAYDRHTLAARVRGPVARLREPAKLLEVEPHPACRPDDLKPYWHVASGLDPSPSRRIGLDARLLARVEGIQAALRKEIGDAMRADIARAKGKDRAALVERRQNLEPMAEWTFGHAFDPVVWVVRETQSYYADYVGSLYVGMVMPWRIPS